jgi:hypothetical protein
MIYLCHRAEGELPTEAILSRDHNAKKGGFPNMGSAFIYTSMQQAVPAPLSKGSGPEPPLIPALKSFVVWDKQDGQGGLKKFIMKSKTNTGKALLAMIKQELKAFLAAEGVFRQMVQDSNNHWSAFAKYLLETRNICFNQCGKADESWLYPLEVGRGVFDECFEVGSVGAERSTVGKHSLQDAGHMMRGALWCHQLMEDFIAALLQDHQRLAGYLLRYLFRNRVTHKEMEAFQSRLADQKTEVKGLDKDWDLGGIAGLWGEAGDDN